MRAGSDPYFGNPRAEMLPFVPAGVQRVLELGCGSGAFAAALKRSGVREVVGIESVPSAAEAARARLDKVLLADVERDVLELPPGAFDCLVCNDVLEHLVDPWAVLNKLRPLLRPGAGLVVSLPNVRFHKVVRHLVWPGQWRYEDDGVLDRTHLRFFTREGARQLVESAGFAIERMQGINATSFPLWMRAINAALLGALDDMRYLQFAIVGRLP